MENFSLEKIIGLKGELTKRFELPDGLFWDVRPRTGGIVIALMEESGMCTPDDMFVEDYFVPFGFDELKPECEYESLNEAVRFSAGYLK